MWSYVSYSWSRTPIYAIEIHYNIWQLIVLIVSSGESTIPFCYTIHIINFHGKDLVFFYDHDHQSVQYNHYIKYMQPNCVNKLIAWHWAVLTEILNLVILFSQEDWLASIML